MSPNNTKKKNKNNNETTTKRPASSSPTGNVSGQGSTSSGPSNTPPLTNSTNKRTRVSAEDSVMDVDKPLAPPGPVETTSAELPSQPDTSLDASAHAPSGDNDKGKAPETTPVVTFPERAASPDASQAAVQSQPILYYASAAPNDVKGFWNHFASNRDACDADDLDAATSSPMDSLFGLHFHAYDPQAIKADEHAPKLYRTAYITYESPAALQNFDSTWGVLCGGHCLRICPASFSPDQRAERRTHVALLAGLPHGTIAVDLAEIANEVSAKSINVPFSMNSYNPKPYAYCHFSSETAMENAKSISCALKKVGLTWHTPAEVTSLCHRCGHPNCNPDRCGRTPNNTDTTHI
ncbi:hypothetical protein RhiirA4_484207 [Rhizophagus irregularis]|uniref:RRM domain-containing protein n=1 Tax=Rhizophagus irregularis TaxID=588596 RepID=A0A2I1HNL5_9GLOM|nr:hypothetical protein RhiirA4_484207 [Rhizophagus irregularis]